MPEKMPSVVVLMLLAIVVASQAPGLAKPGTELRRLETFTGSWTTVGTTQAAHQSGAGKLVTNETFEWMPGGFFLVHRWDSQIGSTTVSGLAIIGFDSRTKSYTSRFFDSTGTSGTLRATPQGNAWTWAGEADLFGRPVKQRCTMILVNPDTFTNKCEYSPDGLKWLTALESRSTRVK